MKTNNYLHYNIAEQGKVYTIEGDFNEALRHYREAIRMAQTQEDSEVFFQHYSQCVMETLEISGAYNQVVSYCERYLEFLKTKSNDDFLVKKHQAVILEKKGIQHIYLGENDLAKSCLEEAQQIVGRGKQKLTDELLGWLQRGYSIGIDKLKQSLHVHKYFVIRKEDLQYDKCFKLPDNFSPF